MKLLANKALRYAGVNIKADGEFDASEKDAKLLIAVKKAREFKRVEVEPEIPKEDKRAYRRKDMRAE